VSANQLVRDTLRQAIGVYARRVIRAALDVVEGAPAHTPFEGLDVWAGSSSAEMDELTERLTRVRDGRKDLLAAAVAAEHVLAVKGWLEDGPDPEAQALRQLRGAIRKARGETRD
jgi:hypothetical protein